MPSSTTPAQGVIECVSRQTLLEDNFAFDDRVLDHDHDHDHDHARLGPHSCKPMQALYAVTFKLFARSPTRSP